MLDYDNTAFNYFAITLISFYLFPALYYTGMEVLRAMEIVKDSSTTLARTSAERQKASKIKEKVCHHTDREQLRGEVPPNASPPKWMEIHIQDHVY